MKVSSVMAVALATVGVLVGPSLVGTSRANAAVCAVAPVATYTTPGFSCNVDGVTFSNINVSSTASSNGASVTLGNFTPFTFTLGDGTQEAGLSLNYAATATQTAGTPSTADVAWTYNVSGNLLSDAYLSLAGSADPGATVRASEVLSNSSTLTLNSAGATTATFTPVPSLFVIKDQQDVSFTNGATAASSIVTNAFSLTTGNRIPEPATLAILGTALLGTGFIRRRRS